jgi:hypothetical protein
MDRNPDAVYSLGYARFPKGRVVHLVLTVHDPVVLDVLNSPDRWRVSPHGVPHVCVARDVLCATWGNRKSAAIPCDPRQARQCENCSHALAIFESFLSDLSRPEPCPCSGACPCHWGGTAAWAPMPLLKALYRERYGA